MRSYLDLVQRILSNGVGLPTRNDVRRTIFVHHLEFDLSAGFPLVTTRKMRFENAWHELRWFLDGGTNVRFLHDNGVHIWDANADQKTGDVGPIYGYQWRNFNGEGVDQIAESIRMLKMERRIHTTRNLVTAMNPAQQREMKLPPCHVSFQLFSDASISADPFVSMLVQLRSTDVVLGLPTNIASYAILLTLFAKLANMRPGMLYMTLGDVHLYTDHVEKVKKQLDREPLPLPTVQVHRVTPDLRGLQAEDVTLHNYQFHSAIKFSLTP